MNDELMQELIFSAIMATVAYLGAVCLFVL